MPNLRVGIAGEGGGGGVLGLGPTQNTFGTSTTADRADAEALRNTYATANSAWLAQYNDNRSFWIRLQWDDGTVEQRRNTAGNGWEDVTNVIRGRMGLVGNPGPYYVEIYRNSATDITLAPVGGSIVVATRAVTAPVGWTTSVPAAVDGETLYAAITLVNTLSQSGTITPTWGIPYLKQGRDGTDGASGGGVNWLTPSSNTTADLTSATSSSSAVDLGYDVTSTQDFFIGAQFESAADDDEDNAAISFVDASRLSEDNSFFIGLGQNDVLHIRLDANGNLLGWRSGGDSGTYRIRIWEVGDLGPSGGGTTVVVNPTAAATDDAVTLQVGTTVYNLPDDVVDVTDSGLPALSEANHKQLFIDHDTPRVWVGHREVTAATAAQGDFTNYSATNYRGALLLNGHTPPNVMPNEFWYDTGYHSWERARSDFIGVAVAFSTLFPNSDWLGEQPDDATAVGLVDNFDATRSYYFYNSGTNRVRVLTNSTYVAAVSREVHYTAEPISSPSAVGTITGITAGAGLDGGGTSGQVTLALDVTAADFPTIPIDKGGTGADTAADARAALGITAAAIRNFLGLSQAEANAIFVGASLTGTTLTFTHNNGITTSFTLPTSGGGTSDGVLTALALANDGEVSATVTGGTDFTADFSDGINALIAAASLSSLQGQVTDAQIPDSIFRDAEFTPAAVRGALGLGAAEANEIFTGASISGNVITFTQNGGTTEEVTLPTASADGVVNSGSYSNGTLTLDRTIGADVTIADVADGTMLFGAGLPASSLGRNGDTYIDTSDGTFYQKTGGNWMSRYTIMGGTVMPTHTQQFLGVAPDSGDHTFVAGDFTGTLGVAYAMGEHTATVPTYTGNRHLAIVRLESDPDIVFVDVGNSGLNQIGGFTKQTDTIEISGSDYEAWVSNQQINASGLVVEAR